MLSVRIRRKLGAFSLDTAFQTERTSGVLAIAGVSGAGKSSVLRCLAGLERPDEGRIALADRVLFDDSLGIDVAVHARRLGVVFQDSRLFPHLRVRANLDYGRPRDGRPETVRFDEVVDVLGIADLLERRPRSLSGGERQRVAIGRALLSSPDLLLLDEPLASLDVARRHEVLPFLAALPRRFSVPIVVVTHNLDAVLQLADELVVMDEGRVVAHGPVTEALATLVDGPGLDAVLEGVVDDRPEGRRVAVSGGLRLHVLGLEHLSAGDRVRMRVPADDVLLAVGPVPPLSVRNRLGAKVVAVRPAARGWVVDLQLDAAPRVRLHARVSQAAVDELGLSPGLPVTALVKAASVRVPGLRAATR